ncbi:MAG: hypothetical protein V4556_00435 [Bacteroidota bacterium]
MQHKIIRNFILLFAILFIITVPFPHEYIPDTGAFINPLSEALVRLTAQYIFHIQHAYTSQLVSDSTGLYIHVFNLLIISLIVIVTMNLIIKKNYDKIFYWFSIVIIYYLALQLFEYGFSKIFKWQFYLPEPNTLYTTLGNSYRDLMYWTTMGLSRPYTIFAGLLEITAACLLLFKRTRLAGALLAFFVLINVAVINFSYDISVKILSCFLLLLALMIIAPYRKKLFAFFFHQEIINKINTASIYSHTISKKNYVLIKLIAIAYILFSTLSPYFIENNFNDDTAERPAFHGAYDVTLFVRNNDTLLPLLNTLRWKRAFVHRKKYFITQDMADDMQDYTLMTDTIDHIFILNREADRKQFKLNYTIYPDSTLGLNGIIDNDSLHIQLRQIDIKKLPALQKEFHWTSDDL